VKPVLIHSKAQVELGEAVRYYESQKQALGLDFQSEVERAVARLQQAPQTGSPYKETDLRRYLVRRFPYIIFYAELEEFIWVVAIAHTKRKPNYWRRRKPE
jgi:toxin ParE1/3/4